VKVFLIFILNYKCNHTCRISGTHGDAQAASSDISEAGQ